MRALGVLFILSLFFCLPAMANKISFSHVNEEDSNRLRKSNPHLFDKSISHYELDQLIRALMSTGNYENVAAYRLSNDSFEIRGVPVRTIEKVTVNGNSVFSTQALLDKINLESGARFSRDLVVKSGEMLKELYGQAGYFNTVIEVDFVKLDKNRLHIKFQVIEKDPCVVTKLKFDTQNQELIKSLKTIERKFTKRDFTSNYLRELERDLNEFFQENQYLSIEIEGPEVSYNADKTRASIKFVLIDPFTYSVFFKGIEDQKKWDLYAYLNLDEFDRSTRDPVGAISDKARQYFRSLGYPNVAVEPHVQELKSLFVQKIILDIKLGSRVRIEEIQISGRVSRPASYYAEYIKTHSSEIIRKGYYNREDLEKGYKNLVTHLQNQGYLKAKVLSARVQYQSDETKASVTLVMDEGPLTQVGRILFKGIKDFDDEELQSVMTIKTGAPLQLKKLEESLDILRKFYSSRGYLEMSILSKDEDLLSYNERGTRADIRLEIYEGPKIVVDSIALEGNSFTHDDVILKTLEFSEGDVLTPELIEDSIAQLNKASLFNRVSIRSLEEGTQIAKRTIIISVSERDPGVFSFGAGVNTERNLTVRAFTGLNYNNLFGTARALSGRLELKSNVAEINYLEHKVTAGYLEPFIFDTKTRGRVNLTQERFVANFKEIENIIGNKMNVTEINEKWRVHLILERDLTRYTKFSWSLWRFDSTKSFERDGFCTDPTEGLHCPSDITEVASVGPRLDVDYRDNPFLPTQGSYHWLDIDYAHPDLGGSTGIEFGKIEAVTTYYWRLGSPQWVWANSLRGGYVENLSDDSNSGVPANQSFFLGGLTTIRGFSGIRNERIPPEYELSIESSNDLIVNDFSYYYLLKSELRFPVYGDWGGVIFYDGGLVHIEGIEFSRPYRHSAGFGVRYNTPIGPLAVDLGFKLNPKTLTADGVKEDAVRLHISIGTF